MSTPKEHLECLRAEAENLKENHLTAADELWIVSEIQLMLDKAEEIFERNGLLKGDQK